jgi:hypothetical protein
LYAFFEVDFYEKSGLGGKMTASGFREAANQPFHPSEPTDHDYSTG